MPLLFSQTLISLLFDVAPFEVATLAAASLLLLALAAAAACSPPRRASRVDPLVALRTEHESSLAGRRGRWGGWAAAEPHVTVPDQPIFNRARRYPGSGWRANPPRGTAYPLSKQPIPAAMVLAPAATIGTHAAHEADLHRGCKGRRLHHHRAPLPCPPKRHSIHRDRGARRHLRQRGPAGADRRGATRVIDRIVIENFKSLRRVDLALGRMNLFVGANGSGKSNLLDALRVLQGIGSGFTISEILDGKPQSATGAAWNGIRGGSGHACFTNGGGREDVTFEVHGDLDIGRIGTDTQESGGGAVFDWEFLSAFSPKSSCVIRERLEVENVIYDTDQMEGFSLKDPKLPVLCPITEVPGWSVQLRRTRPALGQLTAPWRHEGGGVEGTGDTAGSEPPPRGLERGYLASGVAKLLANVQQVEPDTRLLRQYSQVAQVRRMGDRGENFAALVHAICQDEETKDAYLSWLRQLRPEEIDDVGVLRGAVDEPLFMLREKGREFPAMVLSDGTLRFAALTAALFQPDMPSLMLMEEIENGIHASRTRLLLELLRSQSVAVRTQVVATTHSATVLDWLGEEDYKTTFVCKRDEETGESRICALADVPHFMDVVKKRPASELFSEGWLEAAL